MNPEEPSPQMSLEELGIKPLRTSIETQEGTSYLYRGFIEDDREYLFIDSYFTSDLPRWLPNTGIDIVPEKAVRGVDCRVV